MTNSRDEVVRSPSAGRILEILVAVGEAVSIDQEVVLLDSMNVEIPVPAPCAGRVAVILVASGDLVRVGATLLTIAL